jgi:hypothetical protein
MGPVRHGLCGVTDISSVTIASMPPITMRDFADALRRVCVAVLAADCAFTEQEEGAGSCWSDVLLRRGCRFLGRGRPARVYPFPDQAIRGAQ